MEKFDKVNKLSEIARVSFSEARKALEENDWDLLEAMSALEKEGKTQMYNVQELSKKQKVKNFFKKIFHFMNTTSFRITKDFNEVCKLPVWVCAIILLFAWHISILALIIGLIMGYRYSFEGQQDLTVVNHIMDKAGNLADQAKNEFNS